MFHFPVSLAKMAADACSLNTRPGSGIFWIQTYFTQTTGVVSSLSSCDSLQLFPLIFMFPGDGCPPNYTDISISVGSNWDAIPECLDSYHTS